jgi:hypothetical protein
LITNDGKQIIAKYLLGQAPAFATHIAAGCGSKALAPGETIEISENKKSLDFEVFRVPISSRGFVKEDNEEKIVFKAEMPTDQRFQITEVGIFPAQSNAVAGRYDSKLLLTFGSAEPWSYVFEGSASAVPLPPEEGLDEGSENSDISITRPVTFINSDSTIFNNSLRKERQEPPRFLNRALMVQGNSASIDASFNVIGEGYSLENSNIFFDLGQNLPNDEIKLTFSVVSKTATTNTNPNVVRILIEFVNNIQNSNLAAPKAFLRIDATSEDLTFDSKVNRYVLATRKISQFVKDTNFSFANINLVKIYTCVVVNGEPSPNFYVIYDGMKIDNISSLNPLYSMVGYTAVQTSNGYPILKPESTSNYIEYRLGIGVGD